MAQLRVGENGRGGGGMKDRRKEYRQVLYILSLLGQNMLMHYISFQCPYMTTNVFEVKGHIIFVSSHAYFVCPCII